MYRDINVYQELGRRAKIICNDLDATVGGGLLSVNQWAAAATATRRHRQLLHETSSEYDVEEHKRHLREAVPDLTQAQLHDFVTSEQERQAENAAVESCAPLYSTSCIFAVLGADRDGRIH